MKNLITSLYIKSSNAIHSFKQDQRGVTAIEYALVAAAIGGLIAIVFGDGGTFDGVFDDLSTKVKNSVS